MASGSSNHLSRRLFLPGLAKHTKKRDINRRFQQHDVKGVVVLQRPTGNVAFLTFETPEAASKAMKEAEGMVIHKRTLRILRADAWHELKVLPKVSEPPLPPNPFPGYVFKEDPRLPVECITMIARYLPFKERARMERVSRDWRQGSLNSHQGQTRLSTASWVWKDTWISKLTLEGFFWAIQRCSNYITHLDLQNASPLQTQAITIAAKACMKLTHLNIASLTIREPALREIGEHQTNLIHLRIGKCIGPVDPDLTTVLRKNPNLQNLYLEDNTIRGKSLTHALKLTELEVVRCEDLGSEGLATCIRLQSNLRGLGIVNCTNLRHEEVLQAIIDNTSLRDTLTTLKIHSDGPNGVAEEEEDVAEAEIGDFAELAEGAVDVQPSLPAAIRSVTHLTITFCGWVNQTLVEGIAEHMRGIKVLNISINTNIRGQFALDSLANLSQCEELHINNLHPSVGGNCLKSMPSLRILESRDNPGITDEDICGLIRNSRTITHVSVEGCYNIGRPIVDCAYQVLRTWKREEPFRLYLGETAAVPHRKDRNNRFLIITYKRCTQRLF
jgi:hypothetical protein